MDIVPSSQLFISGSGKKDDSGIRNGAFGVSEVPCGGERGFGVRSKSMYPSGDVSYKRWLLWRARTDYDYESN